MSSFIKTFEKDCATLLPLFKQLSSNVVDKEFYQFTRDVDENRLTPLMLMAACGNMQGCIILSKWKIQINAEDRDGKTALFYAVRGGHLECVKLLLAQGADGNWRDYRGATIVHHLLTAFEQSKISKPKLQCMMEYFVQEMGYIVGRSTYDGLTILHEVCRLGLRSIAKLLMQNGANVETTTTAGLTPLASVITSRQPRVGLISDLAQAGANLSKRTSTGLTPTEFASKVLKNKELANALELAKKTYRKHQSTTKISKLRDKNLGLKHRSNAEKVKNMKKRRTESYSGIQVVDKT